MWPYTPPVGFRLWSTGHPGSGNKGAIHSFPATFNIVTFWLLAFSKSWFDELIDSFKHSSISGCFLKANLDLCKLWKEARTWTCAYIIAGRLTFHLTDHFTSISPWHQLHTSMNPVVGVCTLQAIANTLITCQVCTGVAGKEEQEHQAFFWSVKLQRVD